MKKMLICIYYLSIFISLTSCGVSQESQAASKLESRYGEQFTILEIYPSKLGADYYEVKACPTAHQEIIFDAAINTYNENFSDGYVAAKASSEISQMLSDALLDGCYVHTEIGNPQPICYDSSISLENYMGIDPAPWVIVQIFSENIDGLTKKVYEFLENYPEWDTHGTVYQVTSEQMKIIQEHFGKEPSLSFNLKTELEIDGTFENLQ